MRVIKSVNDHISAKVNSLAPPLQDIQCAKRRGNIVNLSLIVKVRQLGMFSIGHHDTLNSDFSILKTYKLFSISEKESFNHSIAKKDDRFLLFLKAFC